MHFYLSFLCCAKFTVCMNSFLLSFFIIPFLFVSDPLLILFMTVKSTTLDDFYNHMADSRELSWQHQQNQWKNSYYSRHVTHFELSIKILHHHSHQHYVESVTWLHQKNLYCCYGVLFLNFNETEFTNDCLKIYFNPNITLFNKSLLSSPNIY